jgi:hypothetical protein
MKQIDPRCLEFIGSKVQELIQHGISVYILNKRCVNNKHAGVFSSYNKSFKVALGDASGGMHTFLHEYAHFLQYKYRSFFWKDNFDYGLALYLCWLEDGVEYKSLTLNNIYNKALELERDAETLALGLISSHNLPLDLENHIYEANANLLFYPWTRLTRKCNANIFNASIDALQKYMPETLFTLDQLRDLKYMKKVFNKVNLL